MIVEQIMQPDVVTVPPEASLKSAADLLASRRISGAPVCAADGTVVGVISETDIIWKEVGELPSRGLLRRLLAYAYGVDRREAALTVGEAMSAPAVTIDARERVAAAAELMICRSVNRLPVTIEGRLVGIVTRADLVRAFTRSDADIAGEIADDVLKETLWIDPDAHPLAVHAGEVSIGGEVESRTTASLIEASIRRVPGVVKLRSQLSWKIDDTTKRVAESANRLPRRL
jgi:CBS domain-containing protein